MEITREIEQNIESDLEMLKGFEVEYKNGGTVTGRAKKIRFSPLGLTILKETPKKGERPKHKVVFDHVVRFALLYEDGKIKNFS